MTLLVRAELERRIDEDIAYWKDTISQKHGYLYCSALIALKDLKVEIRKGTFTAQADSDTIKSETNCPTCGSAVKVGGDGETHYYIPITPSTGLVGDGWIPVSEWKIKSGQKVLVSYLNPLGKRRTVKAFYAEKFKIEQSEESDFLEYDEVTDNYYLPEGWHECIDNWDDYTSVAIYNGTVDYVMPLPQPPSRPTEVEGE